jgi:hypothetical protein
MPRKKRDRRPTPEPAPVVEAGPPAIERFPFRVLVARRQQARAEEIRQMIDNDVQLRRAQNLRELQAKNRRKHGRP